MRLHRKLNTTDQVIVRPEVLGRFVWKSKKHVLSTGKLSGVCHIRIEVYGEVEMRKQGIYETRLTTGIEIG